MKKLIYPLYLILLLAAFNHCKKEENAEKPFEKEQVFKGNTIVKIRYYEYNPYTGQDDFIEEKQYSYNSTIYIKPPLTQDGITESNPFNLQVFPDRVNGMEEEGHIDISSSLIFTVSYGRVLLQYWNYTLTGDQINGTLSENHSAEAAAANMLWAWDDIAGIHMTMPFSLATGATISGTVGQNSLSLYIAGESICTYRKFTCQINASLRK
ncbi:MAG: hypothetical protein KQH67_06115 [Bacteroidetes bacterium]|nr:hypothetical protein [Bacteroidota bacterium]